MADTRLDIEIRARNLATKALKDVERELSGLNRSTATMTRGVMSSFGNMARSVGRHLFSLKSAVIGLIAVLGARKLAGSFLEVAKYGEKLRLTLNAALGSVREGGLLFQDLAKFAAKVPFELREVMGAAVSLSAVMKGGRTEVMKWLPLITDLAAYSESLGLDLNIVVGQIIRMFSAGAAAADTFREKGITAMLGFTSGVKYSVEETRKMLWEAWEKQGSKFRGLTTEMAKGWSGMVSMLHDAWFQFRAAVMEVKIFDTMKAGLKIVLQKIDEFKEKGKFDEWARKISDNILKIFEKLILGVAKIVDMVQPKITVLWDYTKQMWNSFRSLPDWLQEVGILGVFMWGRKGAMVSAGLAGWKKTFEDIDEAYLLRQRTIVTSMEVTVATIEQQTAALAELKKEWVEVSMKEGFHSEKIEKLNKEIAVYNERIAGLREKYNKLQKQLSEFDKEAVKTHEDLKDLPPLVDPDPEGKATKAAHKLIALIRKIREELNAGKDEMLIAATEAGRALAAMYSGLGRVIEKTKELTKEQKKLSEKLTEYFMTPLQKLEAEYKKMLKVAGDNEKLRLQVEKYYTEERKKLTEKELKNFKTGWDEATKHFKDTGQMMHNIGRDVATSLHRAFSDLFYNLMAGVNSFSEAWKAFCTYLKQAFIRAVADIVAAWVTSGIGDLIFGTGGTGTSGFSIGNIIQGIVGLFGKTGTGTGLTGSLRYTGVSGLFGGLTGGTTATGMLGAGAGIGAGGYGIGAGVNYVSGLGYGAGVAPVGATGGSWLGAISPYLTVGALGYLGGGLIGQYTGPAWFNTSGQYAGYGGAAGALAGWYVGGPVGAIIGGVVGAVGGSAIGPTPHKTSGLASFEMTGKQLLEGKWPDPTVYVRTTHGTKESVIASLAIGKMIKDALTPRLLEYQAILQALPYAEEIAKVMGTFSLQTSPMSGRSKHMSMWAYDMAQKAPGQLRDWFSTGLMLAGHNAEALLAGKQYGQMGYSPGTWQPVMGYMQEGGYVKRTGLYHLEQGERVTPKEEGASKVEIHNHFDVTAIDATDLKRKIDSDIVPYLERKLGSSGYLRQIKREIT